jgi:spoIIIJ-associated protein
MVGLMLYCDQVAATEAEAIEAALKKMRLSREDVIVRSVTETPNGVKVRVEATRSRGQEAVAILSALLHRIGVRSDLFYIEYFDKILVNIKGPHLGLIIGKGGSTLEALETVVSAIHNRDFPLYKPVVINPGGYRENKRKALKTLVRRACDAASCGEKVSLPIMRQRDRKQIHQIIKEFPGFKSRSVGEGDERRVCIFRATDEYEEPEPEPEEIKFIPPNRAGDLERGYGSRPAVT